MNKQMKVDLTSFDVDELQAITENAKKLIVEKQQQRLLDAYQKFEDIAEKCNSTIDEILQAGEELEKERSIKYRNPKNPEETWIGRGRKPTWLVDAIESGKSLEDFAV
ncbi:H-NS histone family protein [Psychrobacter sp. I-STPA10]|uniref:H-NS histone family protein n=1 Tax=Psychrobacter sp. I-STPA10 TaxID=2585769 RepID=UPI001E3B107F|nr:H-NS histone family protein [Psychrobacter sp. I-STPA10]